MKVLVISTDGKLVVTDPLWKYARDYFEFEHRTVIREKGLYELVQAMDFSSYDRVIIDSNLRRIGKKTGYRYLKKIPNLVFFDHDMYLTNTPSSEWYKKYPAVLRDIGKIRVVVSGMDLRDQFRAEGIDAEYLPKGYEETRVSDLGRERHIPAAFVGRTKNKAYKERRNFLERVGKQLGIPALRADPGEPYNALLNDIRLFVSADIGYGEYMIKNFEAMAAGCLLLTWSQSQRENQALGFADMENVVLYRSYEEFAERLDYLKQNPGRAAGIAAAGKRLATSRHKWRNRAEEMARLIQADVCPAPTPGWKDRMRLLGVKK